MVGLYLRSKLIPPISMNTKCYVISMNVDVASALMCIYKKVAITAQL